MNISTTRANNILDNQFGGSEISVPTTWYLGLSTTEVTANGVFTEPTISETGYHRLVISNNTSTWNTASNGQKTNKIALAFDTFTTTPEVSGQSGDVFAHYWFLSQSATGNTVDFSGSLVNKVWLAAGVIINIGIGDLQISFNLN